MNRCLVWVAAVVSLMLLSCPQAAEAALVSVNFTIELTDISWDEHYYRCLNLPPMSVGDIFPGSVTYDDTWVPGTGAYTVGFPGDYPPVDEFQYWGMSFHSPVWGDWRKLADTRHESGRTYPHLLFFDGLPYAMDILAHYDMQAHEDEGFAGGGYFATGIADLQDPAFPELVFEEFYLISGTVRFARHPSAVPDGGCGLGFLALACVAMSRARAKSYLVRQDDNFRHQDDSQRF